jgi:hypothetical protein
MTDVAVTAGNVKPSTGARVKTGVAAATITAGQVLYQDPTTKKLGLCDCDSATAAARVPVGIALSGAAADQYVTYQYQGLITVGGTLTKGLVYVASDTPGGIMPAADLEAGDYTTVLGVAYSASQLSMKIHTAGVAL